MIFGWTMAEVFDDVFMKGDKIIFPVLVNFYPPAAVVWVLALFFVVTPSLNARPQLINIVMGVSSRGHSMCGSAFPSSFLSETPAGLSPVDIGSAYRLFHPAITSAQEKIPMGIGVRQLNYRKPSVFLANLYRVFCLKSHKENETSIICGINDKMRGGGYGGRY